MRKITLLLVIFIGTFCFSQQSELHVQGVVQEGQKPLADAEIRIKDKPGTVRSDANGNYDITAQEGDVLVFAYSGMRSQEIILEDVTKTLNVDLFPKVEELDEVVVRKTRIKSQEQLRAEYATNPRLINTAFGILDKDITSFAVRLFDGNKLNLSGVDLASVLLNKFPGLRVERLITDPLTPTIFLRGASGGFFPVIFDVDGLIFTETPSFIQPENIERIAVLSGLGLVTKYGGRANGGVIVINTKGANYFPRSETGKPYDLAQLRDNAYSANTVSKETLYKSEPLYLQNLNAATSFEAAKKVYASAQTTYGNSPFFFIDSYRYFKNTWRKKEFTEGLIANNDFVFNENPVALKALAYAYQEQGDFKKAHEILKEVFILRPHYAQSYMDLANSYRDIGKFRKAAALYTRYQYLISDGFLKMDSENFKTSIHREYDNLVQVHRDDLIEGVTFTGDLPKEDYLGTRIVFEWNDTEAEFELQFVNPKNRYYTWKHSLIANEDQIRDEKLNRYTSSEYLIDNSLAGTWKINAKYLGNKSLTPTYLKATVYYNYGLISQRKEIRVFKLQSKYANQSLFTLVNSGVASSN